MKTVLTYISNDEVSVKTAFDTLMIKYNMDVNAVLGILKQNPIAVANAETWTNLLDEQIEITEEWSIGEVVKIGAIRSHLAKRYTCIQAHTTQVDWEPQLVPALWKEIPPNTPSGYPAWVQPLGAQDAYNVGDRVTHNGQNWESNTPSNVWEPGVFGWTQI